MSKAHINAAVYVYFFHFSGKNNGEVVDMQKKPKKMTQADIMKYEIAAELGLMDKVEATGWKSLTARESGRIGGILAKRKKDLGV